MPICEGCEEEYPKGGAYTTHVRHCDELEVEKQDGDDDEFRPEELKTRIEELEDHLFGQAEYFNDELDRASGRIDSLEELINRMIDNQDELLEAQKELRNDYEEFARIVVELQEEQVLKSAESITGREFESFEQARHWVEAEANDSGKTSLERAVEELAPNQQTEINLEE